MAQGGPDDERPERDQLWGVDVYPGSAPTMTNSDRRPEGGDREFRQKFRYRFDNLLARGSWATLLWLGIVTLCVVGVSALVLAAFGVAFAGSEDTSYFEDFWQSLLRVLDPGTMAGDAGWGRRVLALVITIFGLLVAGTLIGVIAAGVEERIERMRRGRSVVFESGHTVVLGASDRLPTLIRQLMLAGSSNSVVVVMADRDAAEMQDDVRRVVADERSARLVFRSGDPTHPPDLDIVRLQAAEKVIVLSEGDDGDSFAIRTVVAADSVLGGFDTVPIVVELSDVGSAQRLARAYPAGVHPIVLRQAIGRIAAVSLRQPGVGAVAVALLDDRGSDVHIDRVPSLENQSFARILEAYSDARPIGFMSPDDTTVLNPPPDTLFHPGDRLVLVRESGHVAPALPSIDDEAGRAGGPVPAFNSVKSEQHLLILGWNELGAELVDDWVGAVSTSSTVEVLLDGATFGASGIQDLGLPAGVDARLISSLEDIAERLRIAPSIDTILLLAPVGEVDDKGADSHTLLTLVGVRRILSSMGGPTPRVVVEVLDVENVPLIESDHQDDFIVSEAIGSQLIAQLAEQPEARSVFLQLYSPKGASLHLVPTETFGLVGTFSAGDVYRAVYQTGVIAIGYRRKGGDLVLNPPRPQEVELSNGDQLVVIG